MAIKNCTIPFICNIHGKNQVTYLEILITKDHKTRYHSIFSTVDRTQKKLNSCLHRDLFKGQNYAF